VRSFFAELLGWEYETDDTGYTTIRNAGGVNGGTRQQTEQERGIPPNWLPYFTVHDADDAAPRAEQLGARRPVPTTEIRIGRFAVIADPQGAAFAVFGGETAP
jgi:predicted enzyme related to lactoylglutathione lyase